MSDAAFDNDVLTKCSIYLLLEDTFIAAIDKGDALILGSAPYTVPKYIERSASNNPADAIAHFRNCLSKVKIIEPTEDEIGLAAELELAAQAVSAALDAGESQLGAIIISRGLALFATGDKRAIKAFQAIRSTCPKIEKLKGKIACLEQLLLKLLAAGKGDRVRQTVCTNTNVDKSATICFACQNTASTKTDWEEALNSYVAALRLEAVDLLVTPAF